MGGRAFRIFFFDWDGCLADSLPLWHRIYRQRLAARGIRAEHRAIVRELFGDWAGPARFGVTDVSRFAREVQQALEEEAASVRLNPHAAEVLRALRERRARCGVLTAGRRRFVQPVLEREGLMQSLDVLLTLDEVQRYKPDPQIVLRGLEALGGRPEEAVLVGDSNKDIEAARNAGVAAALYFPPANAAYYDLEELRGLGPELIIRDFRELLALAPGGSAGQR